jgi:hypothetical protein
MPLFEGLTALGLMMCRQNMRSWLYRIRPSVTDAKFHKCESVRPDIFGADFERDEVTCNQLRWMPLPLPDSPTDFIRGLQTICGAGRYSMAAFPDPWSKPTDCLVAHPSVRLEMGWDEILEWVHAVRRQKTATASICTAQTPRCRTAASAMRMATCSSCHRRVRKLPADCAARFASHAHDMLACSSSIPSRQNGCGACAQEC